MTDGFANRVDGFRRRVYIEGVKENDTGIQIVLRRHLDRLFSQHRVTDHEQLILECPYLNAPPGHAFDNAAQTISKRNNIADLKWLISLERDPGKQIPQSVLKRK